MRLCIHTQISLGGCFMKKTLKDIELKGKTVLLRVDYNVPLDEEGLIENDERILKSIPTIDHLTDEKAKVVIFSHLGRVKVEEDKEDKSLAIVADHLSNLLGKEVLFSTDTRGSDLEEAVSGLNEGDILVVQNTRFEDADGKKESSNDEELGKYWASLGDVYVLDAFGTAHRSHASTVGIASNIEESAIGLLVEEELKEMVPVIEKPKRPFVLILGGAKVSDKLPVIEHLIDKVDFMLIGGGMAYTFLKAQGKEIGDSIVEEDMVDTAKELLENSGGRIILPDDSLATAEISKDSEAEVFEGDIPEGLKAVDIGLQTIEKFQGILEAAKTVIWNGPMGIFEYDRFSIGTMDIAETLADLEDATTIVGGGDSVSAVEKSGHSDDMTHISTGGGAMLALLSGEKLPAIEAIQDK